MGFENRDYTREGDYTGTLAGWGIDYVSPVVKWLIIVNVIVWLLQIFLTRQYTQADWQRHLDSLPPAMREMYDRQAEAAAKLRESAKDGVAKDKSAEGGEAIDDELSPEHFWMQQRVSIVQEWLELDPRKVVFRGEVWRLLTYAFCHERTGVLHILFNMIVLFWFGVTLETMYGQREFLLFYLTAAVVSGLAHVGLGFATGSMAAAIGASAPSWPCSCYLQFTIPGTRSVFSGSSRSRCAGSSCSTSSMICTHCSWPSPAIGSSRALPMPHIWAGWRSASSIGS